MRRRLECDRLRVFTSKKRFPNVKSMRIKSGTIAIALVAVLSNRAHAQSDPGFTTIVLDCTGRVDRPVFPVVISVSNEEGEWYERRFLGGPDFNLYPVGVVNSAALKEISAIHVLQIIVNRPISKYGPIMPPTVRIIAGAGHSYKQALISAGNGIPIIEEIKKHVPSYPSLVEQLSEFEGCKGYIRQAN